MGGGYILIEDFCQMYSAVELDKYENRLREQAQQVRKSLYGKYANSLVTDKNTSPVRNQSGSGYSTFYGVQDRRQRGSSSPKNKKRLGRSRSNKFIKDD